MIERKVYLGDSVYAEIDSGAILLTTENGYGPSNRIILEPQVYAHLTAWVEALIEQKKEAAK